MISLHDSLCLAIYRLELLSWKWMDIYPYNIFYLIDSDQSVKKSREPHTPHYDINNILCETTCISSNFQYFHWWVIEKCSTFNRLVPDYTGNCHGKLWMWYDNASLASYRACYIFTLTSMFSHRGSCFVFASWAWFHEICKVTYRKSVPLWLVTIYLFLWHSYVTKIPQVGHRKPWIWYKPNGILIWNHCSTHEYLWQETTTWPT